MCSAEEAADLEARLRRIAPDALRIEVPGFSRPADANRFPPGTKVLATDH
jgi:hypothetical protein